uniref:Uncharacterized protein n=1 Tax=Arundo donax TaxID=35708 RepID=A0A0A8YUA7_ARUDO
MSVNCSRNRSINLGVENTHSISNG